jgi:pimeloyl-ACP methyl ester carboxylesterase
MSQTIPMPRIKTRRVHYFSGFDPRGAAFYHRLYREEARKQSAHNNAKLTVGPRQRRNDLVSAWDVSSELDGEQTRTDYQFMHWDDLARANWQRSPWLLWAGGLGPWVKLFTCGYWMRIRSVSKPASLSGAFPAALFLVFLLLASLVGIGVGYFSSLSGLGMWVSLALGGVSSGLVLRSGFAAAEKLGGHWILRTILFVRSWALGEQRPLDRRFDEFASHVIQEQKRNPVDEVLLVGHSIGSIVAVDVAARLTAKSLLEHDRVKLLTLGHCIPMLSFLPEANEFRESMKILATVKAIPWTDVTIPPDPLCFYGLDPLEMLGEIAPGLQGPRMAVARVYRMFRQETYSRLRWNKLRLHFQYLMASELPADYDYFLTTAGPLPLDESLALCEIQSSHV